MTKPNEEKAGKYPAYIRYKEMCQIVGVSRTTLNRLLSDPRNNIPRPFNLYPGTHGVRFSGEEVQEWLKQRESERVSKHPERKSNYDISALI